MTAYVVVRNYGGYWVNCVIAVVWVMLVMVFVLFGLHLWVVYVEWLRATVAYLVIGRVSKEATM